MKFIPTIRYNGSCDEAIALYERTFGCVTQTLVRYSDAVKNGWEKPSPEKDRLVYHSVVFLGGQEVHLTDFAESDEKPAQNLSCDSEEEVVRAFNALCEGGKVVLPLSRPPFVMIMGKAEDRFGVLWSLFCDYK